MAQGIWGTKDVTSVAIFHQQAEAAWSIPSGRMQRLCQHSVGECQDEILMVALGIGWQSLHCRFLWWAWFNLPHYFSLRRENQSLAEEWLGVGSGVSCFQQNLLHAKPKERPFLCLCDHMSAAANCWPWLDHRLLLRKQYQNMNWAFVHIFQRSQSFLQLW